MFDSNILAFMPHDVRGIQKNLKDRQIELLSEVEEDSGASMMLADPDGNMIMFDQVS